MRFLCVALMLLVAPRPSSATEAPVIAVVEAPGTTAPRGRQREIRAEVEQAIKKAGASVIPVAGVPTDLASCNSAVCAPAFGKATKATHLLLVEAAYRNESYQIRLEIYDTKTGRRLGTESNGCPVCTFSKFLSALRETALVMTSNAFKAESPPEPTPTTTAQPEPEPVSAPAVRPTAVKAPPLEVTNEPQARPSALRTWGPRAGVGLGIAAVVGGLWLRSQDGEPETGEPSCDGMSEGRCPYRKNTMAAGTALGLAGLAVGGVSAYFWLTTPSQSAVAVKVGPSSVTLSGRF